MKPGEVSRLEVPRPRPLAEPVTSMRVTEFRDYLACPYRYYLRHRLGLEALDDAAEELDAAAFGTLIHDVLRDFGRHEASGSVDPEVIFALLSDLLDRALADSYGEAPLAAVRIQATQARLRLQKFADWQAGWVREGWRIEQVEWEADEDKAVIVVEGQPMRIRGRIDRIDLHPATGRRVVFDYKTSDTLKSPEQRHRKDGAWIELQLPLYLRLVRAMGIEGPVELGYIVLPKDTSEVGPLLAEWTEDDLREADRTTEEVIEAVWAEKFWPPASPPPAFSEDLAAICDE
jgi:RecB family exonuclease